MVILKLYGQDKQRFNWQRQWNRLLGKKHTVYIILYQIKLFNHFFRNDSIVINPIEGVNADKSLKRTHFEFDYLIPDYDVMVSELAEWVKKHREMYPHYNL